MIAAFYALLFRLAVVVLFLLFGQFALGLFQLGFKDAARIAVSSLLFSAAVTTRSGSRLDCSRKPYRGFLHRRALHHGDIAAQQGFAAASFCILGIVNVFRRCAANAAASEYLRRNGAAKNCQQYGKC